jgi:hypothetical protein
MEFVTCSEGYKCRVKRGERVVSGMSGGDVVT